MFSAFETFSRQGASARGTVGAVAAYSGPGDIVSGTIGWWGLRAYSLAMAGTRAINLRRDSDQAVSDFNTLANGKLDVASIIAFKGAANLFVAKLYDQSGNARDQVQATAANQPKFILNVIGALPAMQFVHASSLWMQASPLAQTNQPVTWSLVFNQSLTGADCRVASSNAGSLTIYNDSQGVTANTLEIYGGSASAAVTCSDGVFHGVQAVFNGATSSINVDGVSTSVSSGAGANFMQNTMTLGAYDSGTVAFYEGYYNEWGVWPSALSGGVQSSLNSNQHTYWGF
jgi:hypothetical protein